MNRSLATIYHEMGQFAKAAEHLQQASRTHSQYPELLLLKQEPASLQALFS